MEKRTIKLETDRLILRKFTIQDAQDMFDSYCSREIVTRFLRWLPHRTCEETSRYLDKVILSQYKQDYSYCWAIELKESGKVVGCVDIRSMDLSTMKCTLGCVLSDDYWQKGLMTEACKKIIEFMFQEGFVRVQSHCQTGNIASKTLLKKLGMTYEGTLRKYDIDRYGQIVDCEIYSIVK